MKYYRENFGADIKRIDYGYEIIVKCICESIFDFNKHSKLKTQMLSRCPNCNELWNFQKCDDEGVFLIRPKTNSMIYFTKEDMK